MEISDKVKKSVSLLLEDEKDLSSLLAKDGLFKQFKKQLLERALNAEMDEHLGYEKHLHSPNENTRNGTSSKQVIIEEGQILLEVPRDRKSTFEPQIVKKRQNRIDGIDDKILTFYAKGLSLSDIKKQVEELYEVEISESLISRVTSEVMEEVISWQNRPLEKVYPIVFFDCLVVKVRQDKRIINKSVYLALGIDVEGKKDLLGMWISENEGAKFWLGVLTEIKNRGTEDILIACTDNLKGLSESISAVFPKSEHQLCIVHQIRNSLKYVSYKDRKFVVQDLKPIYKSATEEEGKLALDVFEEKWAKKYPQIGKSWRSHWANLVIFLSYPKEIRKIIYTTNAIESVNSCLRKVTKNKRLFPSDESVFKSLYLSMRYMFKKWTHPIRNWKEVYGHFMIKFEGRV